MQENHRVSAHAYSYSVAPGLQSTTLLELLDSSLARPQQTWSDVAVSLPPVQAHCDRSEHLLYLLKYYTLCPLVFNSQAPLSVTSMLFIMTSDH